MKKSIFSLLSVVTAIGTLSPTVTIPAVHAQTAVEARAIASDREILDAVYDLLASVQQVRQSIRVSTRIGVNQRLAGRLQNFENSVSHIRNLVIQNASKYEIQTAVTNLKDTLMTMATDLNLTVLALNTQQDWYQMVMDTGALIQAANGPRHNGGNGPGPVIDPRPNPNNPRPNGGRTGYEFSGAIEGNPVLFSGRTAQEFMSNCTTYLQSARLSLVNEMSSKGQSIADVSGYLNTNQICAISLLNADARGYEQYGTTEMKIEGVRVAINNALTDSQVVELLATANFTMSFVNDVTVQGQTYSISGYYPASGLSAVIRYNIARPAPIMKTGSLEGRPFTFSGYRASEIQAQCLDFWAQMDPSLVNDITVNGRQYSSSGYYNATNACMAITAAQ